MNNSNSPYQTSRWSLGDLYPSYDSQEMKSAFAEIEAKVADFEAKRDSLNPQILQLAGSMARTVAAELHIVHVWSMFGERYLHHSGMTAKECQEAKEYEKEQHKKNFDLLLNRIDVTDLKLHVSLLEGDPVEVIPELVTELGIDLLVMGSVGRGGIAGFLIGNTAEEVFNQVDCSLLTLKPKGFITPVTLE